MRYQQEHKANIHKKIVGDAARRLRSQGLAGASVAAVMQDAGLTHGGFYKYFPSKDGLVAESIEEAFQETIRWLVGVAAQAPAGEAWKAIVRAYLSPEHCSHPEKGCPLPALAAELSRSEAEIKDRISASLVRYKEQLVAFMPGRRISQKERAFFVILPAMIGAVALARVMPSTAIQERVLDSMKDFLLQSFTN